jgi:hypothetical protein
MLVCRAFILFDEKRVFRFAKMTAAIRASVARPSVPRRRCFGDNKPAGPLEFGTECARGRFRGAMAFRGLLNRKEDYLYHDSPLIAS